MGRTSFNSICPNFYQCWIVPSKDDPGVATDYTTSTNITFPYTHPPWLFGADTDAGLDRAALTHNSGYRPLKGLWYSYSGLIGTVEQDWLNGVTKGASSKMEGGTTADDTGGGANTPLTGKILQQAYLDQATPCLVDGQATAVDLASWVKVHNGRTWAPVITSGGSDDIRDFFAMVIGSCQELAYTGDSSVNYAFLGADSDAASPEASPSTASPLRAMTRFNGHARGGYFYLPVPSSTTGAGVTQSHSQIQAPMPLKVHGVVFAYSDSGNVANTAKIVNTTKAVDITNDTTLDQTSPSALEVDVDSIIAANRTIDRDDVIEINVTTGAGAPGLQDLGAYLICHTTGHVDTDPASDKMMGTNVAIVNEADYEKNSIGEGTRINLSGPAKGGLVTIPLWPYRTGAGTGQASPGLAVARAIAPQNGEILFSNFAHFGSTATENSFDLYNVTQSQSVATSVNAVAAQDHAMFVSGATSDNVVMVNPDVSKGDVLELRCITGATTGITMPQAYLYMHTTGHYNADVRDD